jgi:two-component system osmolarity sensor histidine kinase EnvZ
MKLINFRTYYSSFWLTFLLALIVNQILLFTIFHFVLIRPVATDLSQIFGVTLEAAKIIDTNDPTNGLNKLQQISQAYPSIVISNKHYDLENIPWQFFGLKMMGKTLKNSNKQKIEIGFIPTSKNRIIIQTTEKPIISMMVLFEGGMVTQKYLGYSFLLVILISICASYWISLRILEPLDSLAKSAIMLTKTDKYNSIHIDKASLPEIKQLANTLNNMRKIIDSSIKERESLLAGVTHDLRTPLSRIRIAVELETFNTPSFKDELLEDIYEMNHIIQQFNELARLEIEVKEQWELSNLNHLILDIDRKYKRANININLNLCENLTDLMLKPLSITRLLYNLIDNGCRFGNGNVTVSTFQNEKEIIIVVSNPIDKDIILSNYKTDPIFTHNTGLGLRLVQKFSEQHNAKLIEIKTQDTREYRVIFQCKS